MPANSFPADWLRGALDLCVMGVLAEGASYGYAISQRLEAAGLGVVKGGTLYPLLARLQAAAFVASTWHSGDSGPSRKYLELTDAGRAELARRREQWRQFSATVDHLARPSETR
ncbi:PadR family transcriptional regulator [Micromonospora musae]|uniref:PadR family transcriptional regulator n=1 Tax=Micromonospora musae TaxID=1894970 RepID=UPI0034105856